MLAGGEAGAVALGQTVVFVQHVNFDFQHPALAHTRRMGSRFTVTVVQIAFCGLARDKGGCLHAGDVQRRASRRGKRRATKRRMGIMLISLYIKVAFTATACRTHRSLLISILR